MWIYTFLTLSPSQMKMKQVILLLGGNLGTREVFLENARIQIKKKIGTILNISSLYESEPWGFEDENLFLNQAIKVNTDIGPMELMETILEIEKTIGRVRTGKLTSRVVDIDILFYGNEKIDLASLIIPHPRIQDRLFALLPLVEITKNQVLPVLNKTAEQLIVECSDKSKIHIYNQCS